jgi:hypothetical protein
MLSSIFDQFVQESPVTVMARGLMERIFAAERMDKLFDTHAKVQYQRELLFSSQVDLMSLVVCDIQKSIHAAYKAKAVELSVSTTALYNKLNGVEIGVSQALVRETAADLKQVIESMGGQQPNPCPGYELKIIDGNCLAGTDHRLDAIRLFAAKALPGKMLVILDPGSKLVVDIFPIEDGHAQERSRFQEVLAVVKPNQIWTGDRNFCTAEFLTTIADTAKFAQLYRDRWSVETLFQTVTANFNGEIQTLAYPKAALFSLAMAFATYNILATIRAVLGSVHGVGKVEAGLSDYYLVDEIQGTYRGMIISIPAPHWQVFETFETTQMGKILQHLAQYVNLNRFLKATRGEKKKRPPLIVNPNHRHVSTARLLQAHQTFTPPEFQNS